CYQHFLHSFPTRRSSDLERMNFDGVYSPKDMAKILDIGDSTLRKWCIALEENDLFFARTENNKRLFTDQDIVILKTFRDLVQVQDRKSTRLNSSHVKISY